MTQVAQRSLCVSVMKPANRQTRGETRVNGSFSATYPRPRSPAARFEELHEASTDRKHVSTVHHSHSPSASQHKELHVDLAIAYPNGSQQKLLGLEELHQAGGRGVGSDDARDGFVGNLQLPDSFLRRASDEAGMT